MTYLSMRIVLATMLATALPGLAAAQFPPPPPPPGSPPPASSNPVENRWPEPPKPSQTGTGGQTPRSAPQSQAAQTRPAQTKPTPPKPHPRSRPAAKSAHQRTSRRPTDVIACSGVFGKDSSDLKLAQKYGARDITPGMVDGSDGSKINASILFPNDPKRRLEVIWSNETARTGTSVIAINGKSQWIAPKGLRLGLPIAALEKLNKRPFKLRGFGADGAATVLDWQDGALSSLPGGCKVGVRLFAKAKTTEKTLQSLSGDKEFLSSDKGLRAVSPIIGEILVGY